MHSNPAKAAAAKRVGSFLIPGGSSNSAAAMRKGR